MTLLKAIIVSDVHIGNPYSNWKKLKEFLEKNRCEMLFLNGDIIDNKFLEDNNKELKAEEIEFINWIMNIKGTSTIYIKGNHENTDIKNKYNLDSHDYYIYEYLSDRCFISHGHLTIFKNPIVNNKIILNTIDCLVRGLGRLQKIHRGLFFKRGKYEIKKGLEFQILSDFSENIFKNGLKIVSMYLKRIKYHSKIHKANIIICGHIHLPEIKKLNYKDKHIIYMNSGDWIDNNTALVQNSSGQWNIMSI